MAFGFSTLLVSKHNTKFSFVFYSLPILNIRSIVKISLSKKLANKFSHQVYEFSKSPRFRVGLDIVLVRTQDMAHEGKNFAQHLSVVYTV